MLAHLFLTQRRGTYLLSKLDCQMVSLTSDEDSVAQVLLSNDFPVINRVIGTYLSRGLEPLECWSICLRTPVARLESAM